MKLTLLLLYVFLFVVSSSGLASVALPDAIKKTLVTAVITGADSRHHYYGPCLTLKCKNLTSSTIEITDVPGRFFMPDDTSVQRMVLTDKLSLVIPAGKEMSVPMYAMCTEANDISPGTDIEFKTGDIATGKILQIVSFIAEHKYQNEEAQHALWCITDNKSPYAIYSDDSVLLHSLVKYTCEVIGIPFVYDYIKNKSMHSGRVVNGEFEYTLPRNMKVDVIVYNENGHVLKNLVTDEQQEAGPHKYSYHLYMPRTEGKVSKQMVILKFYLDGKLINERKHTLSN